MCRERKLLTTWPWLNIHLRYFWSGAAKTKRHQSFHLQECSRLTWYQVGIRSSYRLRAQATEVFWCKAQKPTDDRVAVLWSALLCLCSVILRPSSLHRHMVYVYIRWTSVPCFQRSMNEPLYSSVTALQTQWRLVLPICSASLTKQRAFIYWCSAGDRSRGHIWCCHEIRGEENSIIAITLRRLSKIDQQ